MSDDSKLPQAPTPRPPGTDRLGRGIESLIRRADRIARVRQDIESNLAYESGEVGFIARAFIACVISDWILSSKAMMSDILEDYQALCIYAKLDS